MCSISHSPSCCLIQSLHPTAAALFHPSHMKKAKQASCHSLYTFPYSLMACFLCHTSATTGPQPASPCPSASPPGGGDYKAAGSAAARWEMDRGRLKGARRRSRSQSPPENSNHCGVENVAAAGAKVEAPGLWRRAQIVTCASGQTQTAMTEGGSDIIGHGLAGRMAGL